jgi:putative drug exporter of the RND superfamily
VAHGRSAERLVGDRPSGQGKDGRSGDVTAAHAPHHEGMARYLFKIGSYSARRPWRVIGVWLLCAVAVVAAASAFGKDFEDSFVAPGTDAETATDLLVQASSDQAGVSSRVVVATTDGSPLAARQSDLDEIETTLGSLDNVVAVESAISPSGDIAMVNVRYPVLEETSADDLEHLKDAVADLRTSTGLQVEAGGELHFVYEEPSSSGREIAGILAAIVILLLAFGSVVAMGLPIGLAVFGLGLGIAGLPLLSLVMPVPSWTSGTVSMIGLGVGIDYALFIVTRHREFLAEGRPVAEAAGRAVATAGQSVLFAAGTVVIAVLGLAVAGVPFLTAIAVANSLIVAVMAIASVTLLPAFFGVAGPWVNRLGIHRRGHTVSVGASRTWQRWGTHVAAHPWRYTIVGGAALLALTAPVLSLRLGFPDEGTQPQSRSERRGYDLAARGFGPGINGPLLIAVDLNGEDQLLEPLADAVASDSGIAAVAPPEYDAASGVATIVAFPTTTPQDDATYETVERLRSDVFPSVLDGSGASAHVGGQTANFGDVAKRVSDRLPWFIGAVVLLSYLLLMVVFRSVLVPLKAAVMNLLSIGAAYGVLVMVFQWGWGESLIGLESTVPIVSFIPMFMFAVLFGLSMDYEVFLLSRVREEYAATGDNDRAVIAGLAGTARVITSAALIMICVFAAFVLGTDPVAKMLGVGLAVAIFVDATLVRCVLVPATMKLMGNANWWLPAWLDRRLPSIDLDPSHIGDEVASVHPAPDLVDA